MKINNLNITHLVFIVLASFFVASCSSNDDPDYASQIAKKYTGSIELSVSGNTLDEYMGLGKSLEINRYSNDSIVARLAIDYDTGSMKIETVTAGAKVTYNNGKYILTGGETITSNGSYTIKATLNGEISDNNTAITISFQPGTMPTNIEAKFSSAAATRTLTLNTSDYLMWTYFSFEDGVVATHFIYQDEKGEADGTIIDKDGNVVNENSFGWDIALHRYDIKTNNGGALSSEETDMDKVTHIPTTGYTADVKTEEKVIADLSGMMTTGVKYCPSLLNEVLSSWISRAGMPPVYTKTEWVYIVQTKDKKYAKIKFTDHTNEDGQTGYVTFIYEYPVE